MYKTYILQQMLLDALSVNGIKDASILFNSEMDNNSYNKFDTIFYELYKNSLNNKPILKKMIKFKLL